MAAVLLAVASALLPQPTLHTLRASRIAHVRTALPVVATTTADDDAGGTVQDGAALIAGTAIGGGILALPSCTAPLGFKVTMFIESAVPSIFE